MHKKSVTNFITAFSVGPTLWFYTGDTFDDDFNLLLDYAGRFGYQGQKVTILAGKQDEYSRPKKASTLANALSTNSVFPLA
ncbi:hypothetical protein IIA29_02890 [candidate division KSB1 bacterium]|nr:hypothetical protein [candidate division KSB1 bacterium]